MGDTDSGESSGGNIFAVVAAEDFAELFTALSESDFDEAVEKSDGFGRGAFFFQIKNGNGGINFRGRSEDFRGDGFSDSDVIEQLSSDA